MSDLTELFPGVDLGSPSRNGGCVSPIGRQRSRRPRVRRVRPSTAVLLIELRRRMDEMHAEVMVALGAVRQVRRNEHESLPAVLRRLCEIERVLK